MDILTTVTEASYLRGDDMIISDELLTSHESGEMTVYWKELKNIANQLWDQALGQPITPQGLFRSYDIDAVTLVGIRGETSRLGIVHISQ